MLGKTPMHKSKDVRLVTLPGVKLYAQAAYIKVTEKSLITSDSTGRVVYATYQLAWSVVMRIEYVNPNVLDHLLKLMGHK